MVINGKQIAEEVLDKLRQEVVDRKLSLKIAAILVGNDPGLKKFLELKDKAAKSIGVESESRFFPENISEDDLIKEVSKISNDAEVDGVFIELPLPKHINAQNISCSNNSKNLANIIANEVVESNI